VLVQENVDDALTVHDDVDSVPLRRIQFHLEQQAILKDKRGGILLQDLAAFHAVISGGYKEFDHLEDLMHGWTGNRNAYYASEC
jgi:hypothetical protein